LEAEKSDRNHQDR
jgi:hypothetical protein